MQQISLSQPFDDYCAKWYIFKNTTSGKIYDRISWQTLSACLPGQSGTSVITFFSGHDSCAYDDYIRY